jgi:hypothetical protein
MRILYLLNCYPQISETYIKAELEQVTREHEVRIVAFGPADLTYRKHLPFERIAAGEHDKLDAIVREYAPEVVHGHYFHITPWCFRAAKVAGAKFTVRAHSFDVLGNSLTKFPKVPMAINSPLCAGVLAFPFTIPRMRQIGVNPDKLIPCWPVVDVGRFMDFGSNGDAIMNVGAAIPKKSMESYVDLARSMPERRFSLYSLGYMTDALKRYNDEAGDPVHFVDTIQPEDMPTEYKKHQWLVYTANRKLNTVGWPLAVAEAQASGVGVLMQNIRPDLTEYVGPAGYLFDTPADAQRIIAAGFPEEKRAMGFEHARKSDVASHIRLLYELWR